MPNFAKTLKILEERAGVLREQISKMTDELEAVLTAQKVITGSAENAPRPKPRSVTTIVLPSSDPTRKPN